MAVKMLCVLVRLSSQYRLLLFTRIVCKQVTGMIKVSKMTWCHCTSSVLGKEMEKRWHFRYDQKTGVIGSKMRKLAHCSIHDQWQPKRLIRWQ